jgi:hypothetical protein
MLSPGEIKTVEFELDTNSLSFRNQKLENTVELGRFKLWVSRHSQDEENQSWFEIIK